MRTADRIKLVREKGEYPVRKISSSVEAVEYVRMLYKEDISIYESFFIILLNRSNVTMGYQKISQGITHSTTVDLKFIVHSAIECFADLIARAGACVEVDHRVNRRSHTLTSAM